MKCDNTERGTNKHKFVQNKQQFTLQTGLIKNNQESNCPAAMRQVVTQAAQLQPSIVAGQHVGQGAALHKAS